MIVVSAYCKAEQIDKALESLPNLKGGANSHSTRAYRSIMNYYFDLGEMRKGFAVFDEMVAAGVCCMLLLQSCGKWMGRGGAYMREIRGDG